MKKKIFNFLLVSSLMFAGSILTNCKSNGSLDTKFTFTLQEDDTYSISSKDNINYGNELTIPSSYNNKTVTVVAESGFDNKNISKLNIPNTIKKIEKNAFNNCNNLKDIYFDNQKQSMYCTFNESPVGFNDNVKCCENCFGKLNLPSFVTTDMVENAQFKITCNNINQLGNKVKYDIGYIKDTDIRSKGEFNLDSDKTVYTIDAKVHGILKDAEFSICEGENVKHQFTSKNIKVSAKEYNICPIAGSFPVLLFSLQLKEITNNGTIPTYVALNRPTSYDWDNLTYNMKRFPNVNKELALTDKWQDITNFTSSYVKDLHEANNNSIYHFYIKDHCAELPIKCFSANGITKNQYTVEFFSDGTLTPMVFNGLFGIGEGQSKFDCNAKIETMKKDIENAENYFVSTKKWDPNYLVNNILTYPRSREERITVDPMQNYSLAYTMMYPDTIYQTGRLNKNDNIKPIYNNDPEFYQKIIDTCSQMNTYNLLNKLSEEEKIGFKKMYKFNEEVFKESEEKGHDMVIIIGASWSNEKNNFYAYTKMTMEYYGHETRDYYYKPHPGHPTDLTPERKEIITKLSKEGYNIKELEASIAAELILFFKPSLKASGWSSTTFNSLEDNEKGLALYDMTKQAAKEGQSSSVFYSKFACFYTVATDEIKQKYLGTTEIDDVYLIEYNDEGSKKSQEEYQKHDVSLYLLNEDKFKYFKGTQEVDKEGEPL